MDRRQALCNVGVGLLGLYGCAGLPTFQAALTQGGFELKRSDIAEALLAEGGCVCGRSIYQKILR